MSRQVDQEAKAGLLERIRRSIFRGPIIPRDDRERRWVVFHHLVLHFRPVRVRRSTLRLSHTFGLGGMGLVLFGLLAASGALLAFVYEPFPESAHESLRALGSEMLFGPFVRSVHHWSANLLLAVMILHLLRIFYTQGFHTPRQFNWVIGLGLLALALISSFTGYLLPWDQLSYWAVTISLGMLDYVPVVGGWIQGAIRAGDQVGESTLVRFYSLHTTLLPLSLIIVLSFHFWRVRKAKGVVVPKRVDGKESEDEELVLALPDLFLRELVVALVLMALVFGLAAAGDVALGEAANPGMSPNPVKAPWYFVGFQELLIHFHPLVAVVIIPAIAILALLSLPYLSWSREGEGAWFCSTKGRKMVSVGATTGFIVAAAWVLLDEFRSSSGGALLGDIWPPALLAALLLSFHLGIRKAFEATADETRQATFSLLAMGLLVLTLTGVFFRGPGMALTWPGL